MKSKGTKCEHCGDSPTVGLTNAGHYVCAQCLKFLIAKGLAPPAEVRQFGDVIDEKMTALKKTLEVEDKLGITPSDVSYPPGDARRYGGKFSEGSPYECYWLCCGSTDSRHPTKALCQSRYAPEHIRYGTAEEHRKAQVSDFRAGDKWTPEETARIKAKGGYPLNIRNPLMEQVAGKHYKGMAIQPAEYVFKNGIGHLAGDAIAYISRYRAKNGREDLEKAIHSIQLLIELEYGQK